ncbi:hypothetical protein L798_11613 [Zootermopsis nevadensis]|uniref:MD-2-related lipid-recognition domain-containing protein n=2 Tax=Zootermopsis nevadensis TaxID=136037 RepID=A0A067QWD3_ZOONE|nr:hypothetical protein L798_11613 [Zootermopsis nevadensis]
MKAIGTAICMLVLLGYYPAMATPFVLTLQSAKATCSNIDFINKLDVKIGTDGPLTTLNVKYDIVKEIPQDAMCKTDFFKKEGDEYKKLPLSLIPENCCKVFENDIYKKSMEKQNVPKQCPLKEGSYSLENYTLNTDKWSEDVERGEYKAQFTMAQPSGECLYGQETEWKIADKV